MSKPGKVLSIFILCFLTTFKLSAKELDIVKKGKSKYCILIGENAPESVQEAALELSRLVKSSTGASLEVVHNYEQKGKYIVVGAYDHPGMPDSETLKELPHGAFVMLETGGNLVLAGNDERPAANPAGNRIAVGERSGFYNLSRWKKSLSAGSYNAVIQFARDYLGVRWYMPGNMGEEIPMQSSLRIPKKLHRSEAPYFTQRRFDFTTERTEALDQIEQEGDTDPYYNLALHNSNLHWGRRLRQTNPVVNANGHGWRIWIPADVVMQKDIAKLGDISPYGKSHPEFFALVDGERQVRYTSDQQHGGQLCVSNQEMIREYADNIIRVAKKDPARRMFSLCQNDGATHCECEKCKAWDVENSFSAGSSPDDSNLTDRIMKFQKEVASLVIREIPDARFTVMAYHSTGNAPKRETIPEYFNVQGYYNYLPYRYYIPAKKEQLRTAMEEWGKASNHFHFSTFYFAYGNHSFPWSSPEVLDWTVSLLKQNNVKALEIYQGMFGVTGQPLVGQLGPDTWLLSQLLWDPDQSTEILLNEWYQGCFGNEIGTLIHTYYELIEDAYAKEITLFPDFWDGRSQKQLQIALNVYLEIREQGDALISQAEALAKEQSEKIQWRVKQIATTWHFTTLTLDTWQAFRDTRFDDSDEAMELAISLAKKRELMIHDPANRFSIEPAAIETSAKSASLGIVTELPKAKLPKLIIPELSKAPDLNLEQIDPLWMERGAAFGSMDAPFRNNINSQDVIEGTGTEGRVFYTDEGLYCMMHAHETHMDGLEISDDADKPWKGDVLELFLVPGAGSGGHYQFMVSPSNDALCTAFREDVGADPSYAPDWEHIARIGEEGWTVQMFIPWEAVGGKPKKGDLWLANFCRERYTHQPEISAWSPTGGIFALPNKFGKIIFN